MVPRIVGFFWRGTRSFACVILTAALASATEPVDECISAFESAQVERDQGRLTRARELLLTCSKQECPTVIQQDCREWLFELEPRVPTLVLRARLEDGTDVGDVRVFVDGELLAERLDGRPVRLDPGERMLRWEHADFAPVQNRIVVREGEKNRFVSAVFGGKGEADGSAEASSGSGSRTLPPDSGNGTMTAAWIVGGIGLVGLATSAVLGLMVQGEERTLQDTCAPNCTDEEISGLRTQVLVTNVALGVGIAGVATAAVLMLVSGSAPEPSAAAGLRVHVAPGGAGAMVHGRF